MDTSFGPGALSDADNAALTQAKGLLRKAVATRRKARHPDERAAFDHARFGRFAAFTGLAPADEPDSDPEHQHPEHQHPDRKSPDHKGHDPNGKGPASGMTVAAYMSVAPEPSTLEIVAWLNTLGATVLLPLLGRDANNQPRRDPDWARYHGPDRLKLGFRQIAEPTTAPLGAGALGEADLVLCSGLAGSERGARLGTGGGWWDRALAHANPESPIVMLLNDDEVFEAVPMQQWDRRVDAIITPTRTLGTQAHP